MARNPLAIAASLLVLACSLPAQKKPALTIEGIMRGHGLFGYEPAEVRWSGDNQRIYFHWKQPSDATLKPLDTYVVNRDGLSLRKLAEDEAKFAPPWLGDTSKDQRQTVYIYDGDIFIYDRVASKSRRITRTADIESNPHFTADGKRIWFTRSNNLYLLTLENGMIEEITDVRLPDTPPADPPKGTDSQEFIKKEERDLLDVVKQRAREREDVETRKKRENPKPFTLQARQTIKSLALSPDEKTVIATIVEAGDHSQNAIVPNFVTESAYTEDIKSRALVGDVQSRVRIALLSTDTGEVHWVEHGQKISPAPALKTENPDRDVRLSQPVWSDDGTKAVLLAHSADNKDRWILALDPATGKTRVIATDHDEAWLGGPGVSTLGWLKNNRDVYFQSERTGFSHLYTVSHDGGAARALTGGKWEVASVKISEDKSTFYITTNESDLGQVHLYSMPAEGGPRTKLTALIGHHAPTLSPDEHWIADVYSYTNKPPELFVMENRSGAGETKLTSSPAAEFSVYPWRDVPVIHFTARDGVEVPARLYKPDNFKRGGPAVIFVHGAGYLQNVHRWWSDYPREYMFNQFLMDNGYMVIDVDYRGSAGYGRDWRTAIYRHMGGKDLDDQVDAARWMVSQYGVDPKKIGLYGGSYGGFITLMALFTQPDVFAAGAALRPVTDWAHYNNGYTSGILNLPQKDAEAYRQSSPIYFANGLKGALLICHGMVDINVHFQDTVRLVQKLIELHKENWEVAIFPAEDHGFVQPSSWTDEYKRIYKLFEKNLK